VAVHKPANLTVSGTHAREIEVIICASCPCEIPEITARLIELLEDPLDWAFLEQEATWHGVFPLIYSNPEVQRRTSAEVLDRIGTSARSLVAQNLALSAELVSILELFRAKAVPSMPFKGPVLSVAVYGRLSARTFSDLDILVHRDDVSRAINVLSQRGYQSDFDLTRFGLKEYLRSEHAVPMYNRSRGVNLDLHWRLTERNFLRMSPTEDLLRRGTVVNVMGYPMPSLSIEDLLLYLCVHGAKHQWKRLEWICCLVELIRTNPLMDWTSVLHRARQTRTTRALNLGLLLGLHLFRLSLPAEIASDAQNDRTASRLAKESISGMFRANYKVSWLSKRTRRWMVVLWVSDSWRDRFRMVFFTLFRIPHPEARELFVLPRSISYIYYVLRPVRLVLNCVLQLGEFLKR
jgi:hypothetical protein